MEKVRKIGELIAWADEFDGYAKFYAARDQIGTEVKFAVLDENGTGRAYVQGLRDATDSAEFCAYKITIEPIDYWR